MLLNNITLIFRFFTRYIFLVRWNSPSRPLYMWLSQLECYLVCNNWRRVVVCKEIGNTRNRYAIFILQGPDVVEQLRQCSSITDISGGWNIEWHTFLSHAKYHTDLITTKECKHKNKVHVVQIHLTVFLTLLLRILLLYNFILHKIAILL